MRASNRRPPTAIKHCARYTDHDPQPSAGPVVADTGGSSKILWAIAENGKRGGTRVIHDHAVNQGRLWMILSYGKGFKDDLTPRAEAVLRKINAEW